MDQKVLAALIDHKTYNKLTNYTLDVKTIRENEIPEIYSAKKPNLDRLKTENDKDNWQKFEISNDSKSLFNGEKRKASEKEKEGLKKEDSIQQFLAESQEFILDKSKGSTVDNSLIIAGESSFTIKKCEKIEEEDEEVKKQVDDQYFQKEISTLQ